MPIQCNLCQNWFHGKCEKLKRNEWNNLGNSDIEWFCKQCKTEIFPFHGLDNDELFEGVSGLTQRLHDLQKKCLHLENCVKQNKIETNLSHSCYLSREQLSTQHQLISSTFSLIHFNCRSLKRNFDAIDNLLQSSNSKFSVLAFSETWMNDANGDSFLFI